MIARLLLFVAFLALAPGSGAEALDERIPVEPGGRLEVNLDFGEGLRPDPGSLEVVSHGRPEVRVVARASGWGASDVRYQLEHDAAGVRLNGWVEGSFSWLFGGPQLEVRVFVPRDFGVDLRSTSGPVRVDDVGGAVRVRTHTASVEVSGVAGALKVRARDAAVHASEIAGDVDVRISSGSIVVRGAAGSVRARTADGGIELEQIGGSVHARTDEGDVRIERVAGPVEVKTERGAVSAGFRGTPAGNLETRDGTVEVSFPADAGVRLDAHSGGGDVRGLDGIDVAGDREPDRVLGSINGGGAALRLYTARGDVRLQPR